MKFVREKLTAHGGETIVLFRKEEDLEDLLPFEIKAKRDGVHLSTGRSLWLESQEDLEEFAKAISMAWQDHRSLVPKLEV